MYRTVIIAAFLLVSCGFTSDDPAAQVRTRIENLNADLEKWYAAGRIDLVAAAFTEDAWQMPPNSPPLVGREAIRAYWSEAVTWGVWHFTLSTQAVEVSGPLAVERGTYKLRFAPGENAPESMEAFEDHGNYLVHWRREKDRVWRIAGDAPVSAVALRR